MTTATPAPPLNHDLAPPGLGLLALEMRALWEFGAVLPAWPVLRRAPPGDGHAVQVFPGLSAGDLSTAPLRRYLASLGYKPQGWSQGRNFGPREGVIERAKQALAETCEASGSKVSLIGWSLGGVYARELAKAMPGHVRCVITLGSPFAGPARSTNAWRIYELANRRRSLREHENYDLPVAPPAPTSSIYSRSDGIVAWRGSIQRPDHVRTENIEVLASHLGIGLNPSAWWAVADRLSQPEDQWRPFNRVGLRGLKGLIYPDPSRA